MSIATPLGRLNTIGRRHAGLGTTRLFWGFTAILCVQMLFDLGAGIGYLLEDDDEALPRIAAWGILLVADVAIAVVTRVLGNHLPNWLYWMFVATIVLVLLLDLVANWGVPDPAWSLTAGSSAVISLVLAIPTRSTLDIIVTSSLMTAGLIVAFAFDGGFAPEVLHDTVFTLCQVFFTTMVLALVMAYFRSRVRRDVEQVLSHSMLSAPRLTVGMEQSEQLARLDLAAESLLAAVAEGRVRLPLNAEVARRAGQLATELRLHLLESRSKTWLDLAIAESEILRASATAEDPSNSAGLLTTRQRGALLSALWILSEHRNARGRSTTAPVAIEIAPPVPADESKTLAAVAITITVPWAGRSGIDPGVWEHFAQVGRYLEANAGKGLAVEIRALVPAPTSRVSPVRGTNGAGA